MAPRLPIRATRLYGMQNEFGLTAIAELFGEQDYAEDLRPLGLDIADDFGTLGFGVCRGGV